jgi:hypothetical protein
MSDFIVMIKGRVSTHGDAVVPECDIVLVPLEPGMQFRRGGHDLVEIRDDVIGLSLRDADNLGYEAWVEEQ